MGRLGWVIWIGPMCSQTAKQAGDKGAGKKLEFVQLVALKTAGKAVDPGMSVVSGRKKRQRNRFFPQVS